MHVQNAWLFSLASAESIELHCNKYNYHQVINEQGILYLNSGCQLKSSEVTLVAFESGKSNVIYINPSLNISSFLPTIQHIKISEVTTTFPISEIPKSKSIIFRFPTELDIHHVAHYGHSLSTWIILAAIVIIIITIWRKIGRSSMVPFLLPKLG